MGKAYLIEYRSISTVAPLKPFVNKTISYIQNDISVSEHGQNVVGRSFNDAYFCLDSSFVPALLYKHILMHICG